MVLLGPLLPFKLAMIAALKKKGAYSKGMSFKNIVNKFFNEYVSKKNNKKSNFDELDENYLEEHYLFRTDADSFDWSSDTIEPVMIGTLVTAIVKFFKDKKKKKDVAKATGVPVAKALTPTEQIMANATEQVEKDLEQKAKDEKPIEQGFFKKNLKWFAIGAVVIIAAIFFMRRK